MAQTSSQGLRLAILKSGGLLLLQIRRNRNRDFSCGCPFRAANQCELKAGALYGLHIVPQGGGEDSSQTVLQRPHHGLIGSRSAVVSLLAAVLGIVIRRRQHMDIRLH